jgi:hypothetical protein
LTAQCRGRIWVGGHPWIDVTHVWVRGALQNYLKDHPIKKEFVEALIDDGSLHLPAQILYFHFQAYGLYGIEYRSALRPSLSDDETVSLAAKAATKFTNNILTGQEWRLRSVIPLWVIKMVSNACWERVRRNLSDPETMSRANAMLFGDGLVMLMLRTREDKLNGSNLGDMLDVKRILDFWRKHKDLQEQTRQPIADAYRYLHEAVSAQ